MRHLLTIEYCFVIFCALNCFISISTTATLNRSNERQGKNSAELRSVGVGEHLAYVRHVNEIFDKQRKSETLPKREVLPEKQQTSYTILEFSDATVLGISVYNDLLAVALKDSVVVVNISTATASTPYEKVALLTLPKPLQSNISGFALLNASTVFICDNVVCRLCTVLPTSVCYTYYLDVKIERARPSEGLLVKAVIASDGDLVLRYIGPGDRGPQSHAAIAKYNSLYNETGSITPRQFNIDPEWHTMQHVATGFNRKGYTYFVGSARRYESPLVVGGMKSKKRVYWSAVRISRICDSDQTFRLYSRIEVALRCGNFTWGEEFICNAASYDKHTDTLMVVMQPVVKNKTATACSFKMDKIAAEFEEVWNGCQQYNAYERDDKKKFPHCYNASIPEEIPKGKGCWVYTHGHFGRHMQPCAKFGDGPTKYENCKLHEYNQTAYMFGLLEQFYPYKGTDFASLPPSPTIIWLEKLQGDAALLTYTEEDGKINRVARNTNTYLWTEKLRVDDGFHLAIDPKRSRIFYAVGSQVEARDMTCRSLYDTCESLELFSWSDPLKCKWCEQNRGHGFAFSSSDECSDKIIFSRSCPPFLDEISYLDPQKRNEHRYQLLGGRFDRIENASATFCSVPCNLTKSRNGWICNLPKPLERGFDCLVVFEGTLNTGERFSTTFMKKSGGSLEFPTLKASSKSKGTKAAAAVVCGFIFISLICLIVWIFYRYYEKHRNRLWQGGTESTHFGSYNGTAFPHASVESNSYNGCKLNNYPLMDLNYYRELDKQIEPKLRISEKDIILKDTIGKGNFGVVYKAVYRNRAGFDVEVACKTIDPHAEGVCCGFRDFLREGITMSNFNHPHVMRLIGILLTSKGCPMIITDYLPNGDLHHYLINPENQITLGNLLEFGVQIADGMAYLHEKRFIHRDLAARNCMLDANLRVKISDFGLSRDVSQDGTYVVKNKDRGIPIRWMPIESLVDEQYTFKGDVWAYGVVLWELATRGRIPYENFQMAEILFWLQKGHRLCKPEKCPDILYEKVMLVCWMEDPKRRPTFSELKEMMEDVVNQLKKGISGTSLLSSHYERVSNRSETVTPVSYQKFFPAGPVVTDL